MKNMINRCHIEGYLYDHELSAKVTGEKSKNPGTEFITGTVSIATDEAMTNIVPVHFTYVTATTAKGTANATFNVLKDIVDGNIKTALKAGAEAGKLRIDSAIGLNDFYTDRNGKEELVSAKRNEGGFVHTCATLNADEATRDTFEVDMIITTVTEMEANEERSLPAKVIVKGAVFDFRGSLLPVEFSATNPHAMNYFLGLDASASNPTFTKVWGHQVSETIVRRTVIESAFGPDEIKETPSTHRDWVISGALKSPYIFDEDDSITADELKKAMADRQTYLATVKQRQDEYKASKNAVTPAKNDTGFNF